ncbi:MAG TPA: response regulator [Thermoplasmata archaeon]|nr:response regulator [Thermoplasmata archaeon]
MPNAAVVGSDPDTRALLRSLLHLRHHTVVAEGEGTGALRDVPANEGLDLLVLDSDVPGGGWTEVVTEAIRGRPSLRVILVTERTTREIVRKAERVGVSAVLPRPFLLHEFTEALDKPLPPPGHYSRSGARRSPR